MEDNLEIHLEEVHVEDIHLESVTDVIVWNQLSNIGVSNNILTLEFPIIS